jgi:cbb3-type cytochrome oxidase cytochrome c subunit
MAATDQLYRKQKTLDIVFAVSSIVMLLSIFWMLYQDYSREFKKVQREFRDVEDEVFLRSMVNEFPNAARINALNLVESELAEAKKRLAEQRPEYARAINAAMRDKAIAEDDAKGIKADFDSINSLVVIAQDNADRDSDEDRRKALYQRVEDLQQQANELQAKLTAANRKKADTAEELKKKEADLKEIEKREASALADAMLANGLMDYSAGELTTLGEVEDNLKRVTAKFDLLAKIAASKRWKAGDTFRDLPLIDAFASATKIQQYTLNELTIDYSFKQVTRYDRCTTCHLGFDRAPFDKASLVSLKDAPLEMSEKLEAAHKLLKSRKERGFDLGFSPSDIPAKITPIELKPGQVTEYCAHPRLDVFVDPNSPHPVEKFGCTICHAGQGSSTDFLHAAHTPNSGPQLERWEKDHEWEIAEFWDYPMLASRFVEASCLKCHHQVTDLIRYGSKEEAPKLLRGFNLIRENGCFGCHEISGQKSGRPVGPDLRLEPNILPLQALTPAERTTVLADALNPPGTMRKVGPSLYHLADKTTEEWVRKWLRAPRKFRPDTKMPHFFGLSTNNHEYLELEANEQKDFPDAEINAIAYYLMSESKAYLEGKDHYRADNLARYRGYEARMKQETVLRLQIEEINKEIDTLNHNLADYEEQFAGGISAAKRAETEAKKEAAIKAKDAATKKRNQLEQDILKLALTEKDKKELAEVTNRLKMAGRYALLDKVLDGRITPEDAATRSDLIDTLPTTLADGARKEITNSEGRNVTAEYEKYDKDRQAMDAEKRLARGNRLFREKGCLACHVHEAVTQSGQDEFGRPLSAIPNAEADFGPNLSRLKAKLQSKDQAHRWIVQWVLNPKVYHPRTRMPITHLNVQEASDLADWLLKQEANWNAEDVPAPTMGTLKDLLRVNMTKLLSPGQVDDLMKEGFTSDEINAMKWDADERILNELSEDNLKWYIGKRAINRLGCFGCHSIPGFEAA